MCCCVVSQVRLLADGDNSESHRLPLQELIPPTHRPKTTAAVARRLLSHALSMPQLIDRQGEKELRQQALQKKQMKQQRQEQLDMAWGD